MAGHEVVREARQPAGRVAELGGEVPGPDRDPVRGLGIAGKAEPVAFHMGEVPAGPAGNVGAGRRPGQEQCPHQPVPSRIRPGLPQRGQGFGLRPAGL